MHHCNCLKNNQPDVTCGLSFIFVGSRHSLSTCFELSRSSSYQRLTVQEKWSPDDKLPESSKHVESEWRLPTKIKDSPKVTSCWLFFKQDMKFTRDTTKRNTLPRSSCILIRIISIKMDNRQMFESGSYYTGTARIGRRMKLTTQIPVLSRFKKNVRDYTYILAVSPHICWTEFEHICFSSLLGYSEL